MTRNTDKEWEQYSRYVSKQNRAQLRRSRTKHNKITLQQSQKLWRLGFSHNDEMSKDTAQWWIDFLFKQTPQYRSILRASKGALELQRKIPFSEQWFFRALGILNFPVLNTAYQSRFFGLGLSNAHYDKYIPDVLNVRDKFIIEIDDRSHDNKTEYDQKRDEYFTQLGFSIFRITFRNSNSLVAQMKRLCQDILLKSYNISPEDKELIGSWINNLSDGNRVRREM